MRRFANRHRDVGERRVYSLVCSCPDVANQFAGFAVTRRGRVAGVIRGGLLLRPQHPLIPTAGAGQIELAQRTFEPQRDLVVRKRPRLAREPRDVEELIDAWHGRDAPAQVIGQDRTGQPHDAELAMVYRAHRTPQFIEDALRAAVVAMGQAWPSPASFALVSDRVRSLESIHEYDLTGSLSMSAADLPGGMASRGARP
jgi:hypothetical protein